MVYEILGTGAENARTGREIARILHLNGRDVSQLIEIERRAGKPICATCDNRKPGYFIAKDRAEMERYCNRLRHRAGEIFATRAACLKTIKNMEG